MISEFALCRPDVSVITANPKTAGVARWNFLALWGNLMDKGDDAAHRFVADVSHLNLRDTYSGKNFFLNLC